MTGSKPAHLAIPNSTNRRLPPPRAHKARACAARKRGGQASTHSPRLELLAPCSLFTPAAPVAVASCPTHSSPTLPYRLLHLTSCSLVLPLRVISTASLVNTLPKRRVSYFGPFQTRALSSTTQGPRPSPTAPTDEYIPIRQHSTRSRHKSEDKLSPEAWTAFGQIGAQRCR